MQTEVAALLSRMWKAVSAKRTGWGWIFAVISAVLYVSDRWDSLNSFYGKLKGMGALSNFLVNAARSPLVQLSVFVAGVIWIGIAAVFSAKAAGNKKNNGLKEPTLAQALDERHAQEILTRVVELLKEPGIYPAVDSRQASMGVAVVLPQRSQRLDPIGALIECANDFQSEEEVVRVSKELERHPEHNDPFLPLELQYGNGSFSGKRLKFIMGASMSRRRIETESEALTFLGASWARENGLRQIPYHASPRLYPENPPPVSGVDTSPKAIIELLDDLIVEGTAIEKFCGDMCDGEIAKSKVEPWIARVRSTLRSSAPDYVAAFNDAVTNGGRERLYPPDRGSRTVIEIGEWAKDRVRQKSWQLVFACLVKLTEIRRAMRAKLPL